MKNITSLIFALIVMNGSFSYAQNQDLSLQEEINKKFEQEFRFQSIKLDDKSGVIKANKEVLLKPDQPLPVYGMESFLCFGVDKPFNPEENQQHHGLLLQKLSKDLHGDPWAPPPEKQEVFMEGTITDVKGNTKTFGELVLARPVLLDKGQKVVQVAVCALTYPDSANDVLSVKYKLLRDFEATSVYWHTSNMMELGSKLMTSLTEQNVRIYLEEKQTRLFKANETVSYSPDKPLPVLGKDTNLCFAIGEAKSGSMDEENKLTDSVLGKDPNNQKPFVGKAISSEGVDYEFRTSLNSSWELKEFNTGEVSLCASLVFGDDDCCSCCGGAVSKSERLKEVKLPKEIKTVTFTPPVDIKATSLYWDSSNRDENMREVYRKGAEEDKIRPFRPGPVYKSLAKIYPGDGSQGSTVMETQGIKMGVPDPHYQLEETTGIFLSFSDDFFHITPKESSKARAESIKINGKDVYACTARCFGSDLPWQAIMVFKEPDYFLEIDDGVEFVEWCWKNKIPAVSRSYTDNGWYWKKEQLPERPNDPSQFKTLQEYQDKINNACAGY